MKSVHSFKNVREVNFPKLMIHKKHDFVVLFSSDKKTGVVVLDNTPWFGIGFTQTWDVNTFNDFEGSITLSND